MVYNRSTCTDKLYFFPHWRSPTGHLPVGWFRWVILKDAGPTGQMTGQSGLTTRVWPVGPASFSHTSWMTGHTTGLSESRRTTAGRPLDGRRTPPDGRRTPQDGRRTPQDGRRTPQDAAGHRRTAAGHRRTAAGHRRTAAGHRRTINI